MSPGGSYDSPRAFCLVALPAVDVPVRRFHLAPVVVVGQARVQFHVASGLLAGLVPRAAIGRTRMAERTVTPVNRDEVTHRVARITGHVGHMGTGRVRVADVARTHVSEGVLPTAWQAPQPIAAWMAVASAA